MSLFERVGAFAAARARFDARHPDPALGQALQKAFAALSPSSDPAERIAWNLARDALIADGWQVQASPPASEIENQLFVVGPGPFVPALIRRELVLRGACAVAWQPPSWLTSARERADRWLGHSGALGAAADGIARWYEDVGCRASWRTGEDQAARLGELVAAAFGPHFWDANPEAGALGEVNDLLATLTASTNLALHPESLSAPRPGQRTVHSPAVTLDGRVLVPARTIPAPIPAPARLVRQLLMLEAQDDSPTTARRRADMVRWQETLEEGVQERSPQGLLRDALRFVDEWYADAPDRRKNPWQMQVRRLVGEGLGCATELSDTSTTAWGHPQGTYEGTPERPLWRSLILRGKGAAQVVYVTAHRHPAADALSVVSMGPIPDRITADADHLLLLLSAPAAPAERATRLERLARDLARNAAGWVAQNAPELSSHLVEAARVDLNSWLRPREARVERVDTRAAAETVQLLADVEGPRQLFVPALWRDDWLVGKPLAVQMDNPGPAWRAVKALQDRCGPTLALRLAEPFTAALRVDAWKQDEVAARAVHTLFTRALTALAEEGDQPGIDRLAQDQGELTIGSFKVVVPPDRPPLTREAARPVRVPVTLPGLVHSGEVWIAAERLTPKERSYDEALGRVVERLIDHGLLPRWDYPSGRRDEDVSDPLDRGLERAVCLRGSVWTTRVFRNLLPGYALPPLDDPFVCAFDDAVAGEPRPGGRYYPLPEAAPDAAGRWSLGPKAELERREGALLEAARRWPRLGYLCAELVRTRNFWRRAGTAWSLATLTRYLRALANVVTEANAIAWPAKGEPDGRRALRDAIERLMEPLGALPRMRRGRAPAGVPGLTLAWGIGPNASVPALRASPGSADDAIPTEASDD